MLRRIAAIASVIAIACAVPLFASDPPDLDQPASNQPWTAERANAWYSAQPWFVGSNFISSTAINELEMWQADTFDLPTIDRELGWAQSLGMNTMRVFLHNLLWQQDSAGFLKRMDEFLAVMADGFASSIMFILHGLQSVGSAAPERLGSNNMAPQRSCMVNSGWVQSPGADILKDTSHWDTEVKPYIVGVISHFRDDEQFLILSET